MTGPLISGAKNDRCEERRQDDRPGRQERKHPHRHEEGEDREAGEPKRSDLPHDDDRDQAPDERAGAERRVERAPRSTSLPSNSSYAYTGRPADMPAPRNPSTNDDRRASARAARSRRRKRRPASTPCSRRRRNGLPPRHEHEDQHERDEVGRRVDVEDVRRAEERDERAGERRAERWPRTRVPPSIALFACDIRVSSSPTSSREDRPLGREVRRHEAAQERDDARAGARS